MPRSESSETRRWRLIAHAFGLAAALISTIVLIGWVLNVTALKSVLPGLVSMKANTAIGMLLCAVALALLSTRSIRKPIRHFAAAAAVLALALGALTLSEYLVGWDLRIDQWLFSDLPGSIGTSQPGRMSPASSLCFVLAGAALFTVAQRTLLRVRQPIVAALAASLVVIGALALLGYLLEAGLGYHLWNYTGTAVHTATGFVLLGSGLLALVRSEGGLTWSLDTINTTAFVAAIVLMVIAGGSAYNLAKQLQVTAIWVSHTQEVLKEVQDVVTDVAAVESAQRGYIITGDERLLTQFTQARARVPASLADVRKLVGDDIKQQRRLGQIESLITQSFEFADRTIAARKEQGFAAAQQLVATGTGTALTDRINSLLKDMQDDEHTLLKNRQKQSEAASVTTFLVLPLGLFLTLTTLSLGVFLLNAGVEQRSQAEGVAAVSQARMAGLVNSAMDAIISVDREQHIVLFNAAAEKMFRCSAARAMGQSLDMFIPERFREQHHGHVEGFGKTGVTSRSMRSLGTLSGLRTDGEEFPIEASISQVEVGGESIFTVILRDVTERNRAEEKFRLAVESAPNAVVISDREGHIVLVNEQAEKLFGYTRAELLAESVEVLVPERFRHAHPDYRSGFHSNPAVRSMGVGRDLRARRKDGSEFPVEIGLTPMHTDEGLLVLSAIVDISERRRAEKKFQLAVESAPNGVVMVNSDGCIVLVNAQTERLFGYERAELMGQPVEILVPERYRGRHPAYRDKFLGDPAVRSMGAGRDLYGLRKDGSEFPVEIGLTPIQTEEENLVLSAIVDITERKLAEEALRASEDQFRTMANSIPQLAWMAHADGFIFWYNQRWHDYTGKTPEQMEGWGWQSVHDPEVLPKVLERWRDAIATGQPLEMEFPLRGADGRFRMFLTRVQPLKNSQGSVVQWFGTNTDVDELKRVDESLRDTQARLNSTLAAGSIGTWTWDIVNDCLAADEFTARMFSIDADAAAQGLPAEEYLQVIDEEDRPGVADALARAIQSCGQYDIEYRVRQKEGEFRWLQARGRVEGDEAGNALNFHGAVMDITERKQAAAAVRESEERFRAYVEQASDSIFVHDFSGRFLEVNRQACTSLGYSREELLRMSVFDVETDFDLPKAQVVWGQIQPDQASTVVGHQRRKDGSQFPVEVRFGCFDMGGKRRYLGLVRDITERKLAEQEIRALNADLERRVEERTAALYASEARYRLLFDSIDEGFCIIEMIFDDQEKPVDYRFLEANPSFERLTGLRDAVGKRMREFAPQHEEHWFETYGRIAVTGETTRFQNHAKELNHWYDVYACRFGEQKNQQVAIVFGDITEQKAAEANIAQLNAELQQRAAELNSVFESLPGLYLVLTLDLKIVSASDAYLKATMTTREGILGRNLFEIFTDNPNDPGTTAVANMQASIDRVFRNAAPDIMAIQKHDVRRPDGAFEERYWSPINSPMFGADRQIKYIIHRVEEVTEFVRQKAQPSGSTIELSARVQQMEAEVFQSSQNLQAANQQLEAANKELEAFSYSVSHDLRAPLRHINGFSQALLEDYEDKLDDAGKNYLHQVRGASQEMAQLIDDVLQLARVTRAEMRREPINLSEVARKVIADLRKGDKDRSVVVEIEEGLAAQGDKRLMQVMLINLLGNAWKFTSKREQAEIAFGQAKQNGQSVYFVRDNGAGFDMAYVGKLFRAFQRLHTAGEFEGTGIGLATVQRIVNRHGGRVWAEGKLDEGATFYFTLPDSKELDNGDQSDPAG